MPRSHPDCVLLWFLCLVLRFVGGHPGRHTDACFVYDHSIAPGSGQQWKALPPLPIGRSGGSLLHLKERNALFYTGGAERPKASVYIDYANSWMLPLDNASTTGWMNKMDLPFLSNHMSYVAAKDDLGNDRYYVLAGQLGENEHNGNIDLNYEYDAVREAWVERQKMPFPRGHASSSTIAVSCGFIMVGGITNLTGKTKDIMYYDIPSNTWTKVGESWFGVNTPVCAIDFVRGHLLCETGWATGRFSSRIRIEV
jgi:hypothetical protein